MALQMGVVPVKVKRIDGRSLPVLDKVLAFLVEINYMHCKRRAECPPVC
jgi:hypothetical protein